MPMRTRRLALACLACASAIAIAACGSTTSSSSSTGSSNAAETSAATGSASATTACADPATGSPVDYWELNDNNPQVNLTPENLIAAQLSANIENCKGGAGGHKIVVLNCNDLVNPDKGAACAQQAVSDPNAIGSYVFSQETSSIYPIFLKAKMPVIAPEALAPTDFQYPYTFPLASGFQGLATGDALLAKRYLGASKLSVMAVDLPATQGISALINQGVKAAGYSPSQLQVTKTVFFPASVTDFSSYAEKAADGVGASLCFCGETFTARYVQTARQLGLEEPIIAVDDNVQARDIKTMGPAATHLYYSAHFASNAPVSQQYHAAMIKAGATTTGAAELAWLGVIMIHDAGAQLKAAGKPVNKGTVGTLMRSWTNYSTGGATPPLDFATKFTGFGGALPYLANPNVVFFQVKNGVPVQMSGFVKSIF